MSTYHVESNVTGARWSRDFGTYREAVAVCRELNLRAIGGEAGIYDERGERVMEEPA